MTDRFNNITNKEITKTFQYFIRIDANIKTRDATIACGLK
jgi:hypothetical protein